MKDENKHDINLIQRKLVEMASNDNSCANELQLFDGAPMPIVTGLSCSIEYDKIINQSVSLCCQCAPLSFKALGLCCLS